MNLKYLTSVRGTDLGIVMLQERLEALRVEARRRRVERQAGRAPPGADGRAGNTATESIPEEEGEDR